MVQVELKANITTKPLQDHVYGWLRPNVRPSKLRLGTQFRRSVKEFSTIHRRMRSSLRWTAASPSM